MRTVVREWARRDETKEIFCFRVFTSFPCQAFSSRESGVIRVPAVSLSLIRFFIPLHFPSNLVILTLSIPYTRESISEPPLFQRVQSSEPLKDSHPYFTSLALNEWRAKDEARTLGGSLWRSWAWTPRSNNPLNTSVQNLPVILH